MAICTMVRSVLYPPARFSRSTASIVSFHAFPRFAKTICKAANTENPVIVLPLRPQNSVVICYTFALCSKISAANLTYGPVRSSIRWLLAPLALLQYPDDVHQEKNSAENVSVYPRFFAKKKEYQLQEEETSQFCYATFIRLAVVLPICKIQDSNFCPNELSIQLMAIYEQIKKNLQILLLNNTHDTQSL